MRPAPCALVFAAALALLAAPARAQNDTEQPPSDGGEDAAFLAGEGGEASGEGDEPAPKEEGDEPALQEEGAAAEEGPSEGGGEEDAFLAGEEVQTEEEAALAAPEEEMDTGRAEDPDQMLHAVGARFRWIMIPTWFISMFGVDIKTDPDRHLLVSKPAVGIEYVYRKGGFDITAAVWYMDLGWDGGVSFKEGGKGGNSWEILRNDIKALMISADFIWSTDFADWVAITYGAGLGVGIPFGDLVRTEATQASNGLVECNGPTDPDEWCNESEEYDEVYDLPTGIVPWINFLLGFRFKPHRHVHIHVDGGIGIGAQVGVRAGYIF